MSKKVQPQERQPRTSKAKKEEKVKPGGQVATPTPASTGTTRRPDDFGGSGRSEGPVRIVDQSLDADTLNLLRDVAETAIVDPRGLLTGDQTYTLLRMLAKSTSDALKDPKTQAALIAAAKKLGPQTEQLVSAAMNGMAGKEGSFVKMVTGMLTKAAQLWPQSPPVQLLAKHGGKVLPLVGHVFSAVGVINATRHAITTFATPGVTNQQKLVALLRVAGNITGVFYPPVTALTELAYPTLRELASRRPAAPVEPERDPFADDLTTRPEAEAVTDTPSARPPDSVSALDSVTSPEPVPPSADATSTADGVAPVEGNAPLEATSPTTPAEATTPTTPAAATGGPRAVPGGGTLRVPMGMYELLPDFRKEQLRQNADGPPFQVVDSGQADWTYPFSFDRVVGMDPEEKFRLFNGQYSPQEIEELGRYPIYVPRGQWDALDANTKNLLSAGMRVTVVDTPDWPAGVVVDQLINLEPQARYSMTWPYRTGAHGGMGGVSNTMTEDTMRRNFLAMAGARPV